ncbi:MAG: pyridoxamine 5'-phosphate oxidase [bacterium]|nr:pyridoxamine 5'-phosphate oxidase [bacterium]
MSKKIINDKLRREYNIGQLDESNVAIDPFAQFKFWFKEAINFPVKLPDAMLLATSGNNNHVDARVVLLKNLDENGLTFFTNYSSPKAKQLTENNFATCVFWWSEMERQIRIRGTVKPTDQQTSDDYFKTRPHDSQLAAHASPQSKTIVDRNWLINNFKKAEQSFENKQVIRPANWGGFILNPQSFEFWQGRENRLHDRLYYVKNKNNDWEITRLAP